MYVTVYCDTTGLYTEEEMDFDNMCDLCIPEWIVREWYEQHKTEFDKATMYDLHIPADECTFERWINEVYTADNMDGLYQFAVERDYHPRRYTGEEQELV